MSRRVVLVRHARSSHRARGWMNADGLQRSRDAEAAAGIEADSLASPELMAEAKCAEHIVSSDIARAIDTARLLAPDRFHIPASPLLRETVLEIPGWLPFRWPNAVWEAGIHLQWGYRILRGVDPPDAERQRAAEAAKWLEGLCVENMSVVAVTHGVFRRHLARELLARGWVEEFTRRGYEPLSAWAFVRYNNRGSTR